MRPGSNEIFIVVISRLVYRKGADLLIEVIPEVYHFVFKCELLRLVPLLDLLFVHSHLTWIGFLANLTG